MTLADTRRALHAVAELLVAGPQKAASDTVRLRSLPGGLGSVADPDHRIVDGALVVGGGSWPVDGRTLAELAAESGVSPRRLGDVYPDATAVADDEPLAVGLDDAARIAEAWRIGDEAVGLFAPDQPRVLWPEHFDIGFAVGEVNYGVSPGDGHLDEPYAYVGPWDRDGLDGSFWNAPFGSATPLTELGDAAGVAAYFERGRVLLGP